MWRRMRSATQAQQGMTSLMTQMEYRNNTRR
jgi:hypothetical protein